MGIIFLQFIYFPNDETGHQTKRRKTEKFIYQLNNAVTLYRIERGTPIPRCVVREDHKTVQESTATKQQRNIHDLQGKR